MLSRKRSHTYIFYTNAIYSFKMSNELLCTYQYKTYKKEINLLKTGRERPKRQHNLSSLIV